MCRKLMYLVCSVVLVGLLTGTTYGVIGEVWDFAADWSTVSNPNGQWSYRNATSNALLLADSEPWGGTPGWSNSGAGWTPPWVFVSPGGAPGFGANPGDYISSGGTSYQWASSIAGLLDVSGVIGEVKGWGATTYDVRVNGVSVGGGGGIIPQTPFSLQTPVGVGDIVDFVALGGATGTLVLEHVVPEPMTMSLLGLGGLALIRRRRA